LNINDGFQETGLVTCSFSRTSYTACSETHQRK